MIVEQIDAFKTWLTAVLKPLCQADPAALAKYIIALIKKDKTEDELRKSMIEQLDVFLEEDTKSFVDLVFQTLTTKDYLNVPVIPNTNPPNPNTIKTNSKEVPKETKIIVPPGELSPKEALNGNAKKDLEVKRDLEAKRDREARKNSDVEREERPVRRRSPIRHPSLPRNRTRSRSRSWDRSKRSRSREKSRERNEREREQHRIDREKRERPERPRIWRNKSPPRRYDRRRLSRTPSPIRARSRSRSPRHTHRSRYRNNNRSSASRSRSRSLEKRDRRDSAKEKEGSRPGTPQDNGESEGRNSNVSSAVVAAGGKKRCRDFDEKGYCMRGEMCPFDHGIDPVVLEDTTLSRVLTYNPNGTPNVVSSGIVPNPILNAPGHPMMGQRMPLRSDNAYNPQAPHIWRDGRFRGPRPMGIVRVPPMGQFGPPPNHNRELIPVPVMDNKQPETYTPMYNQQGNFMNTMDHENMYKKKFDYNRLGARHKNPQNCSLELKKVPQGLNSITHLNNHFGKFGKIVNIQVQYEGDPEAALITFSSHAEANAAYRSTEAVLNNRFIKVFWHNVGQQQPQIPGPAGTVEGKQENVPPAPQRSVKDRLGGSTSLVVSNTNKVLNLVQPKADEAEQPPAEEEKKPITKEESKLQAAEAVKKNQELIATQVKVKKNQDVQRKQVLKIQSDLRKKKQDLLEKQLSQQKVLIEKLEKLPAGPQRDIVKETIKKTQEAIEEIKKDLEAAALSAKTTPPKKTKEETQKELLDTELDLITKQQEGADTSEIQKKILELRARVASSKPTRGRGIARRYTPGRHLLSKNNLKPRPVRSINRIAAPVTTVVVPSPTAATFQKHTVDHRPTRLLVSGYEADEQESVLNHFQQYGEVVDYEVDSSLPSITLNYKTRKDAEMALLKGKHFQDRTLSITWSNNKQLHRQRSSSSTTTTKTVMLSDVDEDQLIDSSLLEGDDDLGPEISEEALLQDDEEEDEEDRSWRR
ncbi:RNA-binding protein 26 isoform X2 [Diabrotica virgifera virgifera]|uniref:RNA-binding protein 26 n=1 Tax=Diabrotica virgifera virgifera TaxID=50390 RepID=A0ABM5JPP1_DIAVI|nr:RNA-binding protein 26 isoform X2 [Diabrotica virgifera virgifera]